jgi:hypothetical protein
MASTVPPFGRFRLLPCGPSHLARSISYHIAHEAAMTRVREPRVAGHLARATKPTTLGKRKKSGGDDDAAARPVASCMADTNHRRRRPVLHAADGRWRALRAGGAGDRRRGARGVAGRGPAVGEAGVPQAPAGSKSLKARGGEEEPGDGEGGDGAHRGVGGEGHGGYDVVDSVLASSYVACNVFPALLPYVAMRCERNVLQPCLPIQSLGVTEPRSRKPN